MAQTLNCYIRKETGKGAARKMRAAERIPAVIYGHHTRTIQVSVPEDEFMALWRRMQGKQAILELVVRNDEGDDGKKMQGLLQEYQHDILSRRFLHLDFHQVQAREKVRIFCPVELDGEAPGEKLGGVVDQILREIEVEALPADLPEKVVVDISDLGLGESVNVSSVDLGEKVHILTHLDDPIVSVLAPRKSEEEEEEVVPAGEEAAEPEVISSGEAEDRRKSKEEGNG